MNATHQPLLEVWQIGSVADIPTLLQPVAHALLQAREELTTLMQDFPDSLLWERPAGAASAGFHLQHLSGVLDRVFTYAKALALSPAQLEELHAEDVSPEINLSVANLLSRFDDQVEKALAQLKETDEKTLTEFRGVGRKLLPSAVIGLLVHGAEHIMRHLGQLLVTVKVLKFQHGKL